jgi:hypothetical protein
LSAHHVAAAPVPTELREQPDDEARKILAEAIKVVADGAEGLLRGRRAET